MNYFPLLNATIVFLLPCSVIHIIAFSFFPNTTAIGNVAVEKKLQFVLCKLRQFNTTGQKQYTNIF